MKKSSTYFINKKFFLLALLMLLSVGQGFAGGNTNYYARLTATATGEGKVYASKDNTAPADKDYAATSSAGNNGTTENQSFTFYAFAKANDGYAFKGWSNSQTGDVVSNANPYQVTVTASSSDSNKPSTTTVFAQFVEVTEQTITFLSCEHGSYTATDGTNNVKNSGSMTTQKPVTLTATPASGYKFFGWYTTTDGGKTKNYFSYNATTKDYAFTSSVSVGADFVPSNTPIFMIKGSIDHYTDLNAADKAAGGNGIIVLIDNGTLPSGNYTISKGNTLLIPFNDAYTCYTSDNNAPDVSRDWVTPSVFKTLTMNNGAHIDVNGNISVSAGMFCSHSPASGAGAPNGKYGLIKMNAGSSITVKGGGNLYAWGYISGEGKVEALNGANVYEGFQINGFRGGTAMSSMKNKVFPFNQYYIQNIEVPITIDYGATEYGRTSLHAAVVEVMTSNFVLIGTNDGLFRIKDSKGSLTKKYNSTLDRQEFAIEGNAELQSISLTMSTSKVGSGTVNSSSYVLPITNNMTVNQNSGTLTVEQDVALLPGVELNIGENASLNIADGKNLYLYDADEWGKYSWSPSGDAKIVPVIYSVANGTKTIRSDKDLKDAQINVIGSITATGNLYTTKGGANIYSSGNGKVVMQTVPGASTTYQYTQSNAVTAQEIPVTAAQLHNADGSYVSTTGAAAGTTYYYNPSTGKWSTIDPSIVPPTFKYNDKGHSEFTLTNATNVTVDQVKSEMGKETDPVLSVDLTNATGNIDLASLRSTIDEATGNSNVLLYVATANTNNVQNVVTKGADGNYTASNFVITDKQPIDVPTKFTAANVTYNRNNTKYSGKQQWGTICLPYTLNRTEGSSIRYYRLESVSGNTMTLKEVQTVEANTPAIYSVASNVNAETISFGGTNIAVSANEDKTVGNDIQLVGVQNKVVQLPAKSTDYYYISQNKFWQPTTNAVNIRPQRAYFKTSGVASLAKVLDIVEDGDATGIANISTDGNEPTIVGIYSVNGMKQSELRSGINIVKMSDGTTKKVVIK